MSESRERGELRKALFMAAGCISSGEEVTAKEGEMSFLSLVPYLVLGSGEKTFSLTAIAMLLANFIDEDAPT